MKLEYFVPENIQDIVKRYTDHLKSQDKSEINPEAAIIEGSLELHNYTNIQNKPNNRIQQSIQNQFQSIIQKESQKGKTEQLLNPQFQPQSQQHNINLDEQQKVNPPQSQLIKVQINKEELQESKKKRIWFKGFTIVIILITIVSMVLNKKR